MGREAGLEAPRNFDDFPYSPPPAKEVATAGAVRRRWRLIACLAITGSLCTYLICERLTPLYSAKATVMIDPREPKRTASVTDPMSFLPPSEEGVRKNEIAVIHSRRLAETVISDLNLAQDPEFNPLLRPPSRMRNLLDQGKDTLQRLAVVAGLPVAPPKETHGSAKEQVRDRAVDLFLERLGTTETEASRVVEIRFLSANPERAAAIANAVAAQYIQQKVKQDLSDAGAATRALLLEIRAINNKIRTEEHEIEQMRSEQGRVPAADAKVISEQVSDLSRALISAAGEVAADQARIAELNAARTSRNVASFGSVLASPLIQRLQEEEDQLAAKMSSMSTLFGANHPSVRQARAELNGMRGRIDAEITKVLASYQSDLGTAQAKEAKLRSMLAAAKAEMAKASEADVEVRALQREADANKTVMTQLVARLNDAQALSDSERPDAQVISAATVPLRPSYPPKLAMVSMAFVLSATVGVILAVLLERRDDSIRSTMQLRQMTTARVLGSVPTLARAGRLLSPPARVLTERTSIFVENLRAVWFQIDHARQQQAKTLLITSAVPGEGKSTIAASLTRLLALSGRKVLLIDADLRYPIAHRVLGLQQAPGLAEVISGTRTLAEVQQVDKGSGAFVIAAGGPVASPADLLQLPRLSQIMALLSAEFDAIIIDTPPTLAVHDAGILARQADMTVMVVRWGISATTFAAALQRLHDLDVRVSGIILSMVNRKGAIDPAYPDAGMISRIMRKYYSA